MNLAFHPIVTGLIALGPAALAYWRGRAALADLDDPALPERLLALQGRNASAFGIAIGLLIATAWGQLVWALPLLVLARMLAAYPFRKALHNETWSVWAYLSFYLRLWLAASGFWVLVAIGPAIASTAGTRDWIVGIAVAVVAVAWHARYVSAFKVLLGARPVEAPPIRARFAQLLNECRLPPISLDQVNMRGGAFTNAVALASTRDPAVVVTDTLLAHLDEDEVTAILAHELAHHEQFTPARLKQAARGAWVVIAVSVVLPPMVRLAHLPGIVFALWAVTIFVGLILNLQRRQKHETESDLRAVELTHDPDALIRALTKLHVSARVPRRWEADFERRATHPSLARRIQAIRRATGDKPHELPEPTTFTAADGATSVTFHRDRLEWHEGASMTHAINYQALRELRINVRRSATPQLIAVDSAARRWTLPLQTGDIARVQSVLDVIDVHLAKPGKSAAAPIAGNRIAAMMMAVIALAVGQFAVLLSVVLAIIQPASQIAAAAGVSALVAAVLTWRDLTSWNLTHFNSWLPLTLGLGGTALIATALRNRSDNAGGVAPKKLVVVLATAAALSWLFLAFFGLTAIDFHRNAREWPSAAILTFACAGALAFEQSRTARLGALALALAATAAGYGGSTHFVDRFVADPFVARVPPVNVRSQTTSPVSEFSIDFYPSLLRLSPLGTYVAFVSDDEQDESTIHAGRAGSSLAKRPADDAVFVTESALLLLERESRESVLRLVDLSDNREVWTLKVPVRRPNLSIDRSSRRWRLLGHSADGGIMSAEGQIGSPDILQAQWTSPEDIEYVQPLAVSGGQLVALETRYRGNGAGILRMLPWPALWSLGRAESSLWRLSDRGAEPFATSNTDLKCMASPVFDQPSACAAFDGSRTRFFTLNQETHVLEPRSSVSGNMYVSGMDERGWLHGWWEGTPLAVNLATASGIRFRDHEGQQPYQGAVGQFVVGSIFFEGGQSVIRIHQLR